MIRTSTLLLTILTTTGLGVTTPAQSSTNPTSVHVASVKTDTFWERRGFGFKGNIHYRIYGRVRVVVVDNLGNKVSGALVKGTFSSNRFQKDEIVSGVTGADGSVTILSTQFFSYKSTPTDPNSGPSYTIGFCVDDVSASLPYVPADNVMTCDVISNP